MSLNRWILEVEFKWTTDCGVTVICEAAGNYVDGEIHDLQVGFIFPTLRKHEQLRAFCAISVDYAQIEQHAVITLCERARAELSEAV
jgi:hypothetical protein